MENMNEFTQLSKDELIIRLEEGLKKNEELIVKFKEIGEKVNRDQEELTKIKETQKTIIGYAYAWLDIENFFNTNENLQKYNKLISEKATEEITDLDKCKYMITTINELISRLKGEEKRNKDLFNSLEEIHGTFTALAETTTKINDVEKTIIEDWSSVEEFFDTNEKLQKYSKMQKYNKITSEGIEEDVQPPNKSQHMIATIKRILEICE